MPPLTTLAPLCAMVLPMWTMLSPWSKQSHGCSCQGCMATNHTGTLRNLLNPASGTYTNTRRNSSEPSGTFRTLPLEPTPTRPGTLRNPPELRPSGTNLSEPSGTYLRNLRQHTPEPSEIFQEPSGNLLPEPTPAHTGTLWNLPQPASGTYTSIRRNPPEPSGTRLRNLHQHTPELSGTFFRNLHRHTGTLRNPPEPSPATRTGTHRTLSGLKTPLAYAVGEKNSRQLLRGQQMSCSSMLGALGLSGLLARQCEKQLSPVKMKRASPDHHERWSGGGGPWRSWERMFRQPMFTSLHLIVVTSF